MGRTLRMGMVGGGRDAFIGAVHRMAARLDADYEGGMEFVAGALSSNPEKAKASGQDLGLADDRNYISWEAMLEGERARPETERIDFVSIVTPNHMHFPVAKAFAEGGFNVLLDKPMVHTSTQAAELTSVAQQAGVVFAVTYNYSGYPMVKQAREMVKAGDLGEIRKVVVEYNQGWLATQLEKSGHKQADWRTDPARSGIGGCIGDIGSHAEQLVSYVTELEIDSVCADLTTFVPGRRLDDDANVLLRFKGGAKGLLFASQICVGSENDLRLRVWGSKGGLEWRQEEPNHLVYRPIDGPERVYRRGTDFVGEAAKGATRLPFGHPEAFIEAFANVYRNAGDAIRAGKDDPAGFDYPGLADGSRGVRFIEAVVASSNEDGAWCDLTQSQR